MPFTAFLALAAQQGGVLLTGLIAFSVLGASEYGRVASALAFLNIFVALGSVSSSVVSYRLAILHADEPAFLHAMMCFLRRAVLCSAAVVAVIVVGAVWLYPAQDLLKAGSSVEIATGVAFLVASVLISYQQGYVLARADTISLLVTNIILFAAAVPIAWVLVKTFGYTGYFASLALPLGIRGAILYLREPRRPGSGEPGFHWRKVFFSFMLPATAAGFTTLPSYWLTTEFLFRAPGGAAALGLIAVGISIKQAPMLFATSIISSSGRAVFKAYGEGREEMVTLHRRFFNRAIAPLLFLCAIVSGAAALFLLCGHPVGRTWDVTVVAGGLGLVLALEILYAFVYMPVNMAGMMWRSLLFIAIPKDIGFVLASYILILRIGWPGFLAGLAVWNILAVVFTVVVCRLDARTAVFYRIKLRSRDTSNA